MPAELRAVAKLNRRRVFELLLRTASATLLELGLDERRLGALLGVTSVLHTWTRELAFHPHVHCIVTGGGWSLAERRWTDGNPRFLFPVHVLGALFRGKFLAGLSLLHRRGELRLPDDGPGPCDPEAFDRLCRSLPKHWHVYAKPPFGGPGQVMRYLGGYTHRVGLSNRRLVSLDARGVTFRTKHGKTKTLDPVERRGAPPAGVCARCRWPRRAWACRGRAAPARRPQALARATPRAHRDRRPPLSRVWRSNRRTPAASRRARTTRGGSVTPALPLARLLRCPRRRQCARVLALVVEQLLAGQLAATRRSAQSHATARLSLATPGVISQSHRSRSPQPLCA
ncbi:MAG: transposase [Myxococcales bacterium]|nr:transposase [Myxococcales bacterium]